MLPAKPMASLLPWDSDVLEIAAAGAGFAKDVVVAISLVHGNCAAVQGLAVDVYRPHLLSVVDPLATITAAKHRLSWIRHCHDASPSMSAISGHVDDIVPPARRHGDALGSQQAQARALGPHLNLFAAANQICDMGMGIPKTPVPASFCHNAGPDRLT
jgi:hypothetical protein